MPRNWKRIQSPITHLDSYWMSDSLRLVMIMPFILSRCLNTTQLKQCFVITVKNNFELTNSRQVKAVIVKTWSLFARLYAKVFANVFHKSDYQALDQLVIKLTRILNKIYPDMITTLPNIHVLQHLPLIAATYGTLQNVSVSLKEMMHGVYKRMIPHTNKKNVEFDLIKRDNILQGLRYVIDNGYNARIPEGGGNCIRSILKDEQLICLLEGWYISVPAHHITRLEEYNTVEQEQENVIEPPQECFFNIRVHKKWNTKRIEKEGFVKKISNEIQKNLYEAYRHYLNKETAISFKTLEYYDAISYTIIKEDNVDINIHVGEVIDIEDDGTKNREYAIIRGIFTHQANDYKKYAFFILDWYYDTGRIDDLTGCKIYGLQESKDVLWPHIHSFHIVDRNPHNLESESLSKSNDNDNNKLESSFISLLSEKIKSGDLEHLGLNWLSPTINQFSKNYYNLDSDENEHPKILHKDLITKNKVNKKTRFQEIIINNQVQIDKFKTTQGNINDQQKNKDCHLSSETPTIGLIREHLSNNKEVIGITSEHVSNMCDKMKVMFMQSQNPSSDAITDVAKILLPEQ
ncbi:4980_t:CDS:2 [Rhizophagus irregularis]|nr:4980_t:CDS:2 [Rhizophagus irregularis]